MVFPSRAPSRALLATLRQNASIAPILRARPACRQIRCESTQKNPAPNEEGGKSFKGQLYESAAVRLERERAERARFSRERNEGAGGRNTALTFGISIVCDPKVYVLTSQ